MFYTRGSGKAPSHGMLRTAEEHFSKMEQFQLKAAEDLKMHPSFVEATYCGINDAILVSIKIMRRFSNRPEMRDVETLEFPQVLESVLRRAGAALGYTPEQIAQLLLRSMHEVGKLLVESMNGEIGIEMVQRDPKQIN